MKLTKQYIQDNLVLASGNLNSTRMRKITQSAEEVYCILHEIEPVKCNCGKPTKFLTFKKGYTNNCSIKCSRNVKSSIPLTKEYIHNNLIRENGRLESGKVNKHNETLEEIYCIYFEIINKPKCNCGKTSSFRTFAEGYGNFCSQKCHYASRKPKVKLEDYELYKHTVWAITNKQNLNSLENFSKRGRLDLNPNAYHLDHKYSILEGFKNNIPAYIIGNINNLKMIPAVENCKKQSECSISLTELLSNYIV